MRTYFIKPTLLFLLGFLAFGCSNEAPKTTTPVVIPPTVCPQGYTGSLCATQITPTKISISRIEIVRFPVVCPTAITGYWDYPTNTNPELAIVISDASTATVLDDQSTNYFANASSGLTYYYNYSSPLSINNVTHLFAIQLRDIDPPSSYEVMSNSYFTLYNSTNGFPPVITIINGYTKYNLYVTYTW